MAAPDLVTPPDLGEILRKIPSETLGEFPYGLVRFPNKFHSGRQFPEERFAAARAASSAARAEVFNDFAFGGSGDCKCARAEGTGCGRG